MERRGGFAGRLRLLDGDFALVAGAAGAAEEVTIFAGARSGGAAATGVGATGARDPGALLVSVGEDPDKIAAGVCDVKVGL